MFPLTEKENETRSIFIGLLILELLLGFLQTDRSKWVNSAPFTVGVLIGSVILVGIPFLILYQCALKNPGTKWLMFCKVLRIIGLSFYAISLLSLAGVSLAGMNIFTHLKGAYANPKLTTAISVIIPLLSAILNVIIIRYISKMRTINTNAQVRYIAIQDPNLFDSWDKSTSLNELALLFHVAVEKFPRYEKGLIQEYNKRKLKFNAQ